MLKCVKFKRVVTLAPFDKTRHTDHNKMSHDLFDICKINPI